MAATDPDRVFILMKNAFSLLVVSLLINLSASATTLQKFSFEELVVLSELIIEGQVESVYPSDTEMFLHTRVLIKVNDVLKGDYTGEFIELQFLGGWEGGKALIVAGQDIPEEGEKGFYFIEDSSTQAVNPLLGWSQGHFRIRSDLKGNEYLESDIKQEVVELSDNKNAALAVKLRNMKFRRELVEQAYYSPVTPDELREAVAAFLVNDEGQ
jgi:hypothetical protein